MPDSFAYADPDLLLAPATQGLAVNVASADWTAPSNDPYRGVMVATAGVIVGRQLNDTADVTYPVAAGIVIPLRFLIMRTAGTTASGIVVVR